MNRLISAQAASDYRFLRVLMYAYQVNPSNYSKGVLVISGALICCLAYLDFLITSKEYIFPHLSTTFCSFILRSFELCFFKIKKLLRNFQPLKSEILRNREP